MSLQRPSASATSECPELRALPVADADATADLQDENTADLVVATDSAALPDVDTTPTVDSASSPVNDAGADDPPTIGRWPLAPMPSQSAAGFYAFATCAVSAILITSLPPIESTCPGSKVVSAETSSGSGMQMERAGIGAMSVAESRKMPQPVETRTTQIVAPKSSSAGAAAPLGVVAFESRSFVTSEQAMSAVFILKRTQVLRGTALVYWAARSGSADAGIDFSDASGTARFADGQPQLAIYVRLRNDLLREEDETFKVCLRSARQVRIGGRSCAEATILDDDDIAPT